MVSQLYGISFAPFFDFTLSRKREKGRLVILNVLLSGKPFVAFPKMILNIFEIGTSDFLVGKKESTI